MIKFCPSATIIYNYSVWNLLLLDKFKLKKQKNLEFKLNGSFYCWYFSNNLPNIRLMKLKGTKFQVKVWRFLKKIPRGTVITYSQVAKAIGKPSAIRAVANAIGKNPYPIKIPCHRVIRTDGSIGGYSAQGELE